MRAHYRSPRSMDRSADKSRRFQSDVSPEPMNRTTNIQHQRSGSKSVVAMESALHSQATLLNSIAYTLSQISSVLQSAPGNEIFLLKMSSKYPLGRDRAQSPSRQGYSALPSDRSESTPFVESNTESGRLLKINQHTLQQIQAEAGAIRTAVESLVATKKLEERDNAALSTNLLDKITFAEDTFLNNLSICFKTLSQLTSLLQNLPSDPSPSVFLPETLSQLQNLHGNLNKVLEDFPDFSVEKDQRAGKTETSFLSSPQRPRNSFRERLLRDQGDLTKKLRLSMFALERQQTDDTFNKLNAEIERNQELQAKLESRDHLIHRLILLINEGLDRVVNSISQLVKIADSAEAHAFLNFIASELAHIKTKSSEITSGSVKDSSKQLTNLKEEFEAQKQNWSRTLSEVQGVLEEKNAILMREIEAERQAHEDTNRRLRDMQLRAKEKEDLEVKVKVLQRDLLDRDTKLDQTTKELRNLEPLAQEIENLRIENQALKNKNIERGEEIAHRELHNHQLKEDIAALKKEIGELYRIKEEHQELSEYKANAEVTIKKNFETIEQLRKDFNETQYKLR